MNIKTSNREREGMAVIVVIAFLSILLIFVAGNLRMLHLLRNDLKLIEQQQTNRLAVAGIVTNATVPTNPQTAPANAQ